MNAPPFLLPTLDGTHTKFGYLPSDRAWVGGAVFSNETMQIDGTEQPAFRYILTRHLEVPVFDRAGALIACMLNPSVATEVDPDRTVERMRTAAFNLGYNALVVVNMFALRSKKPARLSQVFDPVGKQNDAAIRWAVELARTTMSDIVCGWGVTVEKKPAWLARARAVAGQLADSHMAAFWYLTAGGHPQHPLYLPNPLTPFPWHGARDYAMSPARDPLT